MKKLTVLVCFVLAIVFTFAGCGQKNDSEEKKDLTKAQLYVCNYNGGYGSEWVEAAADRFEEKYANEVFTEGTKGVQIWVNKIKAGGDAFRSIISTSRDQVYFLENVNYYDFVYDGLCADITDVAQGSLSQFGESGTVEDKMVDSQKNYFKINGKYYGLPHYQGFNGISYDADMFNAKSLYFNKNGEISEKFDSANKSNGVDGIHGTYDDGLPATYDEFFMLCERLSQLGISAISWSGIYQFYVACLLKSLIYDFCGEEAHLFFDFDGKTSKLVDTIDSDGNITYLPETTITEENGYLIYRHEGIYRALQFLQKIIDGKYYSDMTFNGTCSNVDIQDTFLMSSYKTEIKDVAMLVEGVWWQAEADATFTLMEGSYVNSGKYDRKIGWMPLPKANASLIGTESYLEDDNYCVRFISSNTEEKSMPLAKKFLAFCSTNESLAEFNYITGATLGYKYTLTNEQYNALSYFSKSVYDHRQNSEIFYPYSNKDIFYNNKTALADLFTITKAGLSQPSTSMKKNGMTALGYFSAMMDKYNSESWNALRA